MSNVAIHIPDDDLIINISDVHDIQHFITEVISHDSAHNIEGKVRAALGER